MNDISLKQLEIFVAVVEYGGFTRAAEELFFNQSTVARTFRFWSRRSARSCSCAPTAAMFA